jgi:hypothetical protein
LGEAYTAVADDAVSAFYNPAGLAAVSRIELAATHTQWVQGGRHGSLAAAFPTKFGTWAVHAVTLSFDDLERRASDTSSADSTFGAMDAAYGVSYGDKAGAFSWGLGGAYVRQTLDGVSAGAPTGSVGGQWKMPVPGLTLGAAVRNIGGSIKFEQEGDPLPLTAAVGAAGRFMNNRLVGTIEARSVRNESAGFGAGIEASPPLTQTAFGRLRAGYRSDGSDADDASGVLVRRWGVVSTVGVRRVLGALRRAGRHVPLFLPIYVLRHAENKIAAGVGTPFWWSRRLGDAGRLVADARRAVKEGADMLEIRADLFAKSYFKPIGCPGCCDRFVGKFVGLCF